MNPQVISALIAFFSAIVGLGFNEWLKRQSINKAVLSEVKRLQDVIESHTKFIASQHEKQVAVPLIAFGTQVYDQQVAQIGLLANDYVSDVVTFYGYVKFLNAFQTTRGPDIFHPTWAAFDEAYLDTLQKFVAKFEGRFRKAFAEYKIPDLDHDVGS